MLFVGAISLLSIVTLRQDVAGSADADSLVLAGQSLVADPRLDVPARPRRDGRRERPVPRHDHVPVPPRAPVDPHPRPHRRPADPRLGRRPWRSVAGSRSSGRPCSLTLPIAIWEFSLGVYLTVKGFKPSPVLDDEPVHALAA